MLAGSAGPKEAVSKTRTVPDKSQNVANSDQFLFFVRTFPVPSQVLILSTQNSIVLHIYRGGNITCLFKFLGWFLQGKTVWSFT